MNEFRTLKAKHAALEVRAGADGGTMVSGYAAVFNRYSQNLGGYVEQVDPAAFTRTLQSADVMGLLNHDAAHVLGRSSAGTLRLSVDGTGLRYEVDLNGTTASRDLAENVRLGNITGSSFSFRVMPEGDEWAYTDQGFPLRTLHDVELFDVGPGVFPAYLDTETTGALALRSLAASRGLDTDAVLAAAKANELRALLENDTREPEGPVAATPTDLTVYRRHLELIEAEMELRFAAHR